MATFTGNKPIRAHEWDAAADLTASHDGWIPAGARALIKTGTFIQMNPSEVAFVCSRSGLAFKSGVHVLNAPGVIDAGYEDEIGVILHNTADVNFHYGKGDRIAQILVLNLGFMEAESATVALRAMGGFGSTGLGIAA